MQTARRGTSRDPSRPRAGDDRRGQRMLAHVLETCREPQQRRLVDAWQRLDGSQRRLAFSQRAGLVDDEGRDALETSSASAFSNEHADLSAAAGADHDRHRRGETQCTRTRDDQHGDRIDERVGEPRLGTNSRPDDERHDRHHDDRGHEPCGHRVGEALNRRARALRLGDHPHDLREQRVAADSRALR